VGRRMGCLYFPSSRMGGPLSLPSTCHAAASGTFTVSTLPLLAEGLQTGADKLEGLSTVA